MTNTIEYGRQSGKKERRAKAPWSRIAALAGVATVLWLAAGLHPDAAGGRRTFALVRGGTVTSSTGGTVRPTTGRTFTSSAGGSFALCAVTRQANCVIDGDTIRLGGIKIRLEDIDAPEVFSPKCPSELARGHRATERLLALINAGPFELVRTGARDQDRYGRKLRTLERAGRSLGAVLVAEGLARPWDGARHPWCG